ncbi:MAG TPA: choice-of-anchor Q domain-containing protein [Steroidobacteraceae bacterium]|nr:choice-of-anchor Q domain-containing protein [Steroidobacteraceae bacterium]
MPPSAPILGVSPQVRLAFEEGCRALFATSQRPPWKGRATHDVLLRFAEHYQRLSALPRRARRAVERRWKRSLSAIALLLTLGQAPAVAAIMQVAPGTPPSISANGKCSLVEAIVNANRDARPHLDCVAGSGLDTIVLPANSQQVLSAERMLPITSAIVIEGNGSTIKRNTNSRLNFLSVSAGGNLTLNETTVTASEGLYAVGYGVSNRGRLTLTNSSLARTGGLHNSGGVAVLNDSSVTGTRTGPENYPYGGIQNRDGGTLIVSNSVISGNSAQFRGGGLYNASNSTATLTDSLVADNNISYEGSGGGIFNYGTLVLMGTTVSGNRAEFGAGIANGGTATIRRSTISGNEINVQYNYQGAGGIGNFGKLTLANSTVSNNVAPGYGGGITSSNNGTLTIASSTVTGNELTADVSVGYYQRGGGLAVFDGAVTLQRSIVSGNTASTVREIWVDPDVVVKANDFNVFGHGGDAGVAGFTPGSTDIVPNDPLGGILLPLADNGGTTRTHALAIGSPALNASPDDENCPAVDQRQNPRPRGPACDVGSFEGSAVLCGGRVTTMVGTDGDDELTGTPGPDVIAGLNGNDAIGGLESNDVICGGGGADSLFGAAGNDLLLGQGGNDRLFGHSGNDALNGGTGQDQCDGGIHSGAGDTATACETVKNVP